MKDKLKEVKTIIEREVGGKLSTPNRKRELTYARAVFCKIGRELSSNRRPIALSTIGGHINRDHSSVIHNIKVVFPFAMQEERFKALYETLQTLFVFTEEEGFTNEEVTLRERLKRLEEENQVLKLKLRLIDKGNNRFNDLFQTLDYDELDEVYEKMSIMVRAIKNRVYI